MDKGVLACTEDAADHLDSVVVKLGAGKKLLSQGKYRESYESLASDLDRYCFTEYEDSLAVQYYLATGLAAYLMGEPGNSISFYRSALDITLVSDRTSPDDRISALMRMGIAYRELGDLHLSVDLLEEALFYAQQGEPGNLNIGKCASALGNVNIRRENYEAARENFKAALENFAPVFGPESPQIAALTGSLGVAYMELDSFAESLDAHLQALAIRKKILPPDHSTLAINYNNLGDTYLRMGKLDEAEDHYLESRSIWLSGLGPDHPNLAITYYNEGDVLFGRGQKIEALEAYQQALAILDPAKRRAMWSVEHVHYDPVSYPIQLEILQRKAKVLRSLGGAEKDLAESVYREFDLLLLEMRKGFQREGSGRELIGLSLETYEDAVGYFMDHGVIGGDGRLEALQFAESAKEVIYDVALNSQVALEQTSVVASLVAREKTAQKRIHEVRQQMTGPGISYDERKELQQELVAAKQDYHDLIDTFRLNYPEFYALRHGGRQALSIDSTTLPSGTLVLSYFVGEELVYGFQIWGGDIRGMELGHKEELDRRVNGLLTRITSRQKVEGLASEFSQAFVQPLLEGLDLEAVQRCIIFRDGSLSYLPFDFLPLNGEGSDRKMLIEGFPLSYGFSLRSYLLERRPRREAGAYIGFARGFADRSDPATADHAVLVNAVPEVETAQELLGGEIFVDGMATEAQFRESAPGGAVLHLASHAYLNDENPLYSRLILAPEKNSDGELFAYEVLDLDLGAEMTILSACNTGSGQYKRGEGTMSLAKSFAYAGCPAIVMNHWEANDKGSLELIGNFLDGISEGLEKDVALQKAKLDYLSEANEVTSHPYFWSVMGLVGDHSSIELEGKGDSPWLLLILILGTLGMVYFGYRLFRDSKVEADTPFT